MTAKSGLERCIGIEANAAIDALPIDKDLGLAGGIDGIDVYEVAVRHTESRQRSQLQKPLFLFRCRESTILNAIVLVVKL